METHSACHATWVRTGRPQGSVAEVTKSTRSPSEGGHSIATWAPPCAYCPAIEIGVREGRLFQRCNVALSGASRHATTGETYVETVNLPVPDRWGEPQNVLTV